MAAAVYSRIKLDPFPDPQQPVRSLTTFRSPRQAPASQHLARTVHRRVSHPGVSQLRAWNIHTGGLGPTLRVTPLFVDSAGPTSLSAVFALASLARPLWCAGKWALGHSRAFWTCLQLAGVHLVEAAIVRSVSSGTILYLFFLSQSVVKSASFFLFVFSPSAKDLSTCEIPLNPLCLGKMVITMIPELVLTLRPVRHLPTVVASDGAKHRRASC